MRLKLTTLFVFLFAISSYGQNKIFYDVEGVGTTEDNASFYRIISGDTAKDYFMTGEVYGTGTTLKLDPKDDSKTIWKGKHTCYYKTGGLRSVDFYNADGKRDSVSVHYYESGKMQLRMHCKNGANVGKFYEEWDEFGKEEKVFREDFDKGNVYDWPLNTNAKHSCKIKRDTGLYMQTITGDGVAQAIDLPMDQLQNYSLETTVEYLGGHEDGWHGLIWGFKDWENYCFFYISARGDFSTGAMVDGLLHYSVYDKYSTEINTGKEANLLKIFKKRNSITFSINNVAVDVEMPYMVTDKTFRASGAAVGFADGGGGVGVAGGAGVLHTSQVTRKYIVDKALMYTLKGNFTGFILGEDEPQKCIFKNIMVRQRPEVNDSSLTSDTITSPGSTTTNEFKGWRASGSGFFIDKAGYIATNYHVIENSTRIEVDAIQGGDRVFLKAKVIAVDKANDLAVLKVTDSAFQKYDVLPYSLNTETADVGSNAFALGFPMASLLGTEVKFTEGTISSKTGFQGRPETYQISVPVQHGNSGCPLFDYDGNVIGIVNSGVVGVGVSNVAYAIKTSYLKTFIETLPEKFALPSDNSLAAKPLTGKIKVLSNYVVMIKVK